MTLMEHVLMHVKEMVVCWLLDDHQNQIGIMHCKECSQHIVINCMRMMSADSGFDATDDNGERSDGC